MTVEDQGIGSRPASEKAAPDGSDNPAPVSPQAGSPQSTPHPPLPVPDLRVARILEARDHPNADRLLVMKIGLGVEERQIVAGIRSHYRPEDLAGKAIVVVANLQHAKLRGEWSQGMLLAAEDEDGRLGVLLAPDAQPGTHLAVRDGPPPDAEITFPGFHENTLLAGPAGVTLNGAPLEGARLVMDREVYGRLK